MTREDIIAMARDAGFETKHEMAWVHNWEITPTLERFAALVAAKERDKWMDRVHTLILGEREGCAKVCRSEADRALWNFQNDLPQNESFWNGAEQMASSCENAIKARGETK